ncbi:MAG: hypothetical protein K2X03_28010 [Bryobacteraceae bacterium]|nr:hypothetical protein [Bryobacteraceae bacterium]
MKSKLSFAIRYGILASMALSIPAFAQCPADITTVLAGRWTFRANNNSVAGQFTARQGNFRLSVVSTTIIGSSLVRYDSGGGVYSLNPDCNGGVLYLNNSYAPVQWEFTLTPDAVFGRVMTFRTGAIPSAPPFPTPPAVLGNAPLGNAWPAPTACPAGVLPVNSLSGVYNTVSLSGVTLTVPSPSSAPVGSITGRITVGPSLNFAGVLANRGTLTFLQTPTYLPPPNSPPANAPQLPQVSQGGDPGQYFMDSDCSTGVLTMYFAWPRPLTYDLYARTALDGTFSYVALGASFTGDTFLASGGTIAR